MRLLRAVILALLVSSSLAIVKPAMAQTADAIAVTDLEITDLNGIALVNAAVGEQAKIMTTVETKELVGKYLLIFEVRDSEGITVHLNYKEDSRQGKVVISDSWIPDRLNSFQLRVFVISDLDSPRILSGLALLNIEVKEQSQPKSVSLDTGVDKGPGSSVTPVETAGYTLLVYVVGSDLESDYYAATADILEMMEAGSTSDVHVIIETGGSANSTKDTQREIDFTVVQRYKVLRGDLELVDQVGSQNMGDPETLADFLKWGVKTFPAERYALIMWDHGNGIRGFGYDDIYDDYLTLNEIDLALSLAHSESLKKFELIGFDACLMSTMEVAMILEPYARYMVSSQEVEPVWGWDYSAIVRVLADNPEQSGVELGRMIADSYFAHSVKQSDLLENYDVVDGLTISVLDLSKIAKLENAAKIVGISIEAQINGKAEAVALARAIQASERYGQGASIESGHVDISSLAKNLVVDFEVSDWLPEMKEAAENAVVYNLHGDSKPDASGLSIFLHHEALEDAEFEENLVRGWAGSLQKSKAIFDKDSDPPTFSVSRSNNLLGGRINGGDISNVYLVIFDIDEESDALELMTLEELRMSEIVSGYGGVSHTWDGSMISFCNGTSDCFPVWKYGGSAGESTVFFPVRLESEQFSGNTTLIYSIRPEGGFDFLGGWPGIDENGNAVRTLLPLREGDKLYVTSQVSDQSDIRDIERGPLVVGSDFSPRYETYPGDYGMAFFACDFSSNCALSYIYLPDTG